MAGRPSIVWRHPAASPFERTSRQSGPLPYCLCVLLCFSLTTLSPPALAESPLTPILGVAPAVLDFGRVPVGSFGDTTLFLSNDAEDPSSILRVAEITTSGVSFSIIDCPSLPITIPGDSTVVPILIRFRPTAPHVPPGEVDIEARDALNSPRVIPLIGEGYFDLEFAQGQLIGYDSDGRPMLCGVGGDSLGLFQPKTQGDALVSVLPISRSWACIPSIIRNDGIESFLVEVDVKSPGVTSVTLENLNVQLVPVIPQTPPYALRDDGMGTDGVAGDFIYTSPAFTFNTNTSMTTHYGNDPNSPAGLQYDRDVGDVIIVELDQTRSEFLLPPRIGFLRSDIPTATSSSHGSDIIASPHVINLKTSEQLTQRWHRFSDLTALTTLTNRIYDAFGDIPHFFILFSSYKIEKLPAIEQNSPNGRAGYFHAVRRNFSGTGATPIDNSQDFGSNGVLLGVATLEVGNRGINTTNATHELTHEWACHIDPAFPIVDSPPSPHYNVRSSVASLLGGFSWIDNGNGTYTIDCTQGRNGGYSACPLDKYMIGLIEGASVAPLYVDADLPPPPAFCSTTVSQQDIDATVTVADIQVAHGVRSPGPATAQRDFVIAFIVESDRRFLTPSELTFYEILAEHYTRAIPLPAPYLSTTNWVPMTRFFGEGTTWTTPVIGIANLPGAAPGFSLALAAPSVFSQSTRITYALPGQLDVDLRIYSVTGRLVRRLVQGIQGPGTFTVYWDGRNDRGAMTPSGLYYYRLQAGNRSASNSLVLVR